MPRYIRVATEEASVSEFKDPLVVEFQGATTQHNISTVSRLARFLFPEPAKYGRGKAVLPMHCPASQGSSSVRKPVQLRKSAVSAMLLRLLTLAWCPAPHVSLHGPYSLQSVKSHPPSFLPPSTTVNVANSRGQSLCCYILLCKAKIRYLVIRYAPHCGQQLPG